MANDKLMLMVSIIGLITFTATTLLNYKIIERIKERKKITLALIFLRKPIHQSLKTMVLGVIIMGLSSIITIYGFLTQNLLLSKAIRIGSAIAFIAYFVFFLTIYIYTDQEIPEKIEEKMQI